MSGYGRRLSGLVKAGVIATSVAMLATVAGAGPDLTSTSAAHRAKPAPGQRWGSAAGQEHLVKGRVNTTLPTSHRGRYPANPGLSEPRNTASTETGASAARTGFDKATSRELAEARGAFERVYTNSDGTETTEFSADAVNYPVGRGKWAAIDTRLVANAHGWANETNSVKLQFAPKADSAELAGMRLDDDHSIAYALKDAKPVAGVADGSTVTYPGAQPGVDLRYEARPGGFKETLVLHSADAPHKFVFPLRLKGLTAQVADGQLVLTDPGGAVRAIVPPGDMVDATTALSKGVAYRIVDGPALEVTLDSGWLRDPVRKYPVLVDPTVKLPVDSDAADTSMYVRGGSSTSGASELLAGSVGGASAASYVNFASLVDRLRHHNIFGAQLQLVNFDANSCRERPVTIHPVTQSWSASGSYSYPGPAVGGALASKSFAHGYVANGQSSSACPPEAQLFNLGGDGVKLVQGWVSGTTPNNGLSIRANVSDSLSGKKFAGSGTANPPKLYVTHSPYGAEYAIPNPVPNPPVLQNQDGKVKVTVTNRSAAAWDTSYYLAYRVYKADTHASVGQFRAANLPGSVARGATVTLDATIKALPPGKYFLDFTMVRTGGIVFTDQQVQPIRLVLQIVDIPPVVQDLHPPNGYQTPTLTPQLWGRALDIDAPPGATLSYKFEICERDDAGNPVGCFNSGYLKSTSWTVPDGRLSWSKAYLWRVFVKDGSNEVPSPMSTLLAEVPQPELTSRIAGAPKTAQGREFDAQTGNFSTVAVDATVTTVGPELNLIRTYNSLDPRRDGAFGVGWTTRYDMRLIPDDDGTGNVVITYPDGQAVRFGRNPNGSYATSGGRTASLTQESGGWKLADRDGSVYQFSSSGLFTKITDAAQRSVVLTYNTSDGKLAKVQVSNSQTNTAGRSLRFTWSGKHVSSVTTDANTTWNYTYTGDVLTTVCAPGNHCTRYEYGAGSHYRTAVLDSRPESYWRLSEAQGTSAGSEVAVNLGKDVGTYTEVTLGAPGPLAGTTQTAAVFNGSWSRVDLPKGTLKKSRDTAVELWFKAGVTGTGGPLLGYQDKAFGTTPGRGVPVLYVGTDGLLRGQFGNTAIAPIASPGRVNDGEWHHAVLSSMGSTQTLYLDGKQIGQATGVTVDHSLLTFNQIGAASVSTPASWPAWGTTGQRFFSGSIDEVAVYAHPLGKSSVEAHFGYGRTAADQMTTLTLPSGSVASRATYDAGLNRIATYTDRNGGLWKVGPPAVYGDETDLRRSVQVLDPGNRPSLYEYDGLTGHLLRSGTPLGLELREEDRPQDPVPPPNPPVEQCNKPDPGDPQFCTIIPGDAGGPVFVRHPLTGMAIRSYQYDDRGNMAIVTNENGDTVTMTHDDRGNTVSTKTCRTATNCQTKYTKYPATATNPFDPRNELPLETRDGRSASATDPTYRTAFTYTPTGETETQTMPDGSTIRHTYTTGTEGAVNGGIMPPGLVLTTTDTRNKTTRYAYYSNGDLARLTGPSGLVTTYTYDVLGRVISETETSDTYPSGVTTTFAYDALSRQTRETEPATTDAVNGTRHQRQVVTTYDADGNAVKEEESDLLGGDATRTTTTQYDEFGRPIRVTDPEGNESTSSYDRFGNVVSTMDENGNRYGYAYTAHNALAEVRLRSYTSDSQGGLVGDYLVLRSYSYDFAGRMASQTDAMGRRVEYMYNGDDRPSKVVLKNFHDPNGSTRGYVISENTYDGAGNLTKQVSGNGTMTVEQTYDRAGNVTATIEDPAGLARKTTFTHDAAGNVTRTSKAGKASNVPWPVSTAPEVVDFEYDSAGNAIKETVSVGTTTLVTTSKYDQRGNLISTTDPRGNVAGADPVAYTITYTYDELDRQIVESGAPVVAESNGGAGQTVRPTIKHGYNTFDEQVTLQDEAGTITRSAYDRAGRLVSESEPSYQAPGAPAPVTPITRTRYDGAGNVIEEIDPRGNSVRYAYDQLNRLVSKDQPTTTNDVRAIWKYTYTRTGQMLSTTDPLGGRTEATYDDLDRQITATQVERRPVADNFVSRVSYDDAGRVTLSESPSGAKSSTVYDTLGQVLRTTDPSGVATHFGYDYAGRTVRQSDALNQTLQTTFDSAGRAVAEADLRPNGTVARTQRRAYDLSGNVISATDALGVTTTFEYDADDRLTKQVEPVSATSSITTTFGYDAAGRRTRYTNGLGHNTIYTYNTLGLTESLIEPPTPAFPTAADRTWTASYDVAGNPVRMAAPGGVVSAVEFDAADRPAKQTGSGASVSTPDQTRAFDALNRLVEISAPGGTNTYTYNDRGDMLTARGQAGSADYEYDADGNLTKRADAAGTAQFTYTNGRLTTTADGLTPVVQQLGYDAAGRVSIIGYGSGRARTFGYDELGRNTSDTLKNGTGQAVFSIGYRYDDNDQLVGKTTAGTAGAGDNTYTHDFAGRLMSWTGPNGTVDYAWDPAGNRVKNGAKTATYDARNQLLSDGDHTYSYTARGTLASRTKPGQTESYEFDAFDRMVKAGGQTYAYDGLSRLFSRGASTFKYAGLSEEPVSDGATRYARGAADDLLATSSGSLVLSDEHEDVVGQFPAGDTTLAGLSGSTAYSPFGQVTAEQGDTGNVGYQGDWTDPDTGHVNMGARWYNPSTGTFDSRDSAGYPGGDSILANRYTYGAGNPLDYTDPDGHFPWKKIGNAIKSGVSKVVRAVTSFARSSYRSVRDEIGYAGRQFKSFAKRVVKAAKSVVKSVGKKVKSGYKKVKSWVGSGKKWISRGVSKLAKRGVSWIREQKDRIAEVKQRAREFVEEKRRQVAETKRKIEKKKRELAAKARRVTQQARAAISDAVKRTPLKHVIAAVKPVVSAVKQVVSTVPELPALRVSFTRDSVSDTVKSAEAIYQKAFISADSVVRHVSDAVVQTVKQEVEDFCDGGFDCLWEASWQATTTITGTRAVNIFSGSPDYVVLDTGAFFGGRATPKKIGFSFALTLTRHGQVSVASGTGRGTPGASAALRYGWLNKAEPSKEEVNGFVLGDATAVDGSRPIRPPFSASYGAVVSTGSPQYRSYEFGIGVGGTTTSSSLVQSHGVKVGDLSDACGWNVGGGSALALKTALCR